jgi:HAMP domain-containing protein
LLLCCSANSKAMSHKASKLERLHERRSIQIEKEIALLDRIILQAEEIEALNAEIARLKEQLERRENE